MSDMGQIRDNVRAGKTLTAQEIATVATGLLGQHERIERTLRARVARLEEERASLERSNAVIDKGRCEVMAQNDELFKRVARLEAVGLTVVNALDGALGDTDPSIDPDATDDDVRDEHPVFWACQQMSAALAEGDEA